MQLNPKTLGIALICNYISSLSSDNFARWLRNKSTSPAWIARFEILPIDGFELLLGSVATSLGLWRSQHLEGIFFSSRLLRGLRRLGQPGSVVGSRPPVGCGRGWAVFGVLADVHWRQWLELNFVRVGLFCHFSRFGLLLTPKGLFFNTFLLPLLITTAL